MKSYKLIHVPLFPNEDERAIDILETSIREGMVLYILH